MVTLFIPVFSRGIEFLDRREFQPRAECGKHESSRTSTSYSNSEVSRGVKEKRGRTDKYVVEAMIQPEWTA